MNMQLRTKMKRRVARLILVILSTTFSVCVAEVFLRFSPLSDKLGWTRNHTAEEKISRLTAKLPGELRILGLGDSFSDYRDADGKNYLRFMEQYAAHNGIRLSVINLSRAGTGVEEYRRVFQTHSNAVNADIVTIGIYLGDDIACPTNATPTSQPQHKDGRSMEGAASTTMKDALKRHSVLLNAIFRRSKYYVPALRSGTYERNLETLKTRSGTPEDVINSRLAEIDKRIVKMSKSDLINPWSLPTALVYPEYYSKLYLLNDDAWTETLTCFLEYLGRFGDEVRQSGSEPVFVLIPDSIVVGQDYHSNYYERLGFEVEENMHSINPVPLIETVKQYLNSNHFKYVDLLPSLRRHNGNLYIPLDMHFNTSGQALAGKSVFEALLEFGLVQVHDQDIKSISDEVPSPNANADARVKGP